MTLFDALRHQWRQRVRSPTWSRSLIGALFLVLAVFLGLGVWGREAVALDQSAFFNYQGNTTTTFAGGFLGMLVAMTLPVGLWVGLGRSVALVSVLTLGALGVALSPVWARGIGRLLYRQRYAMASGFRDE